jgi:hypothetical protein
VHHSGLIPGTGEPMYSIRSQTKQRERVRPGDWIVILGDGALEVYRPEDFARLFERVDGEYSALHRGQLTPEQRAEAANELEPR